ncbi:MAG: hypothetical protein JJT90_11900 [Ectothiorhodospiraceae bacterium]|nr:hypothetical protein [Ectothiorhodospiraceae bacterium]
MNTSPRTGVPSRRPGFLGRLAAARQHSAVQALQLHAPEALERIVAQADARLEPAFAEEVERLLSVPGALSLRHADTLMPLMRERFGVGQARWNALDAEERRGLRKTCDACGVAGRCWRAMRGGEPAETCRGFCPNAAAFDGLAAGQVSP